MQIRLLDYSHLRRSLLEGLRFYLWRLIRLALLILACTVGRSYLAAYAQTQGSLEVLPPEVSNFPDFSIRFRLGKLTPVPVGGLLLQNLTLFENDKKVSPLSLEVQQVGVHFTLAINGSREFDIRDAQGVSPFMQISTALMDWVETRRFKPEDTLSLVVREGALIRNTIDRNAWNIALEAYQPSFREMTPNLAALERALNLSEERAVPFGVEKVVLYITPPPLGEEIAEITSLIEFANQAGIRVYVWMLGDAYFQTNAQGAALFDLAAQTGGESHYFMGPESLPDLETYLEGLGRVYEVQYQSLIREAGVYTVELVVDLPEGTVQGESRAFTIDVQPPKPILLSPPALINRKLLKGQEGETTGLSPASQPIEFLLEYLDDYERELVTSKLVVDGQVVDQHLEPPFTSLTWDLTQIDESGTHFIQVWVEDGLGLTGETILTPIRVELQQPEIKPDFSAGKIGVLLIGIILTVTILLIIIWAIRNLRQNKAGKRSSRKDAKNAKQTVRDDSYMIKLNGKVSINLLPLDAEKFDDNQKVHMLTKSITILGSDPERVDLVLHGVDIDKVHACLSIQHNGYWLKDLASEGGTWVNYIPIEEKPVQLFPGDIIHIGNLGFRFTIADSSSPTAAKVEAYTPWI